ncbi:MAG: isoprenyl transferase [Gammaproteobacteria bacterium]|nr:isoprenyl transferase [Gammaproteobacteria bacterium]
MSAHENTQIDGGIPNHVAIIMDGNGRWAKKRGLPRIAGHHKGVEMVREIIKACSAKGIGYLTLFAFSSENWRRPEREVTLLMDLFLSALEQEVKKLHKNNIKFRVVGDTKAFGDRIVHKIEEAERLTRNNTGLTVLVAANYGGRWDISQACAQIALKVKSGEIDPDTITPETIQSFLSLHDIPDPDLFIRSGGEQRISNFLLWQLAYSELYFTDTLWPDFGAQEFDDALASYSQRQRRFGLTGEQVETLKHA